jgi:twitching motility protein PilT
MKLDDVLKLLDREGVTEVALQSGRLACVVAGGKIEPVSRDSVGPEQLAKMLHDAAGAEHVAKESASWSYAAPTGARYAVTIGKRGEHRIARFQKLGGGTERRPSRRPPPSPAAAPAPRRSKRPPPPSPAAVTGPREIELDEPRAALPSITLETDAEPAPNASRGRLSDVFDQLLSRARSSGASDLHLVADRPGLLRIAGELVSASTPIPARVVEKIVVPRIPPRLAATFEREGSCDFAFVHPQHGRFRANVSRQRTGLKLSLRLVPAEVPTLASLGLPASIGQATHHHQGLIVVTGPTGHGKTTTLAAIVDIINGETSHHVLTVEDPIEFVHPRKRAIMSQREVGTHTKSFASALKASLREDPDVIVVGELRDTETVRMALAASETGHLVISTMNTPSAAKTIDRLIDLFPPGDQAQVRTTLAGGLRLVVSQRLLPTANGDGVVAAAEVLPGSVALWNLIRENKTFQIPSLQQRGKSLGIVRLDDSLAELVRAGRVTLETALSYAEAPDDLEQQITASSRTPAAPEPPKRPPPGQTAKDAAGAMLQRAGTIFGRKG